MTFSHPAIPVSQAASPYWTLLDAPQRIHLLRTIAVLAGIVVPLLVIGRGAAAILVPVIGGLVAASLYWPRRFDTLLTGLRRPLPLALAVMFVLWLPSVAGSIKPGFSFAIWLQVAGLCVFIAGLTALLAETPSLHRWTMRILLAMSVVGCMIAAISLLIWPGILELVRPVKFGTYSTPVNYLKSYAAVMPCLAPVLLWAGFRLSGAWRTVAIFAVILGAVVVYATANRAAIGGYAGVVLFAGAALAMKRASRRARAAAVIAALAAAIAIVAYVLTHLPPMPFQGVESLRLPTWLVDAHRQAIWSFVFDKALMAPWFGWGPSTANFLPGADDPVPFLGQSYVPLHAHNWLLQLFSDVGAIGVAAAAAALAVFLLQLDRRFRGGDNGALAALGLSGAFFVSTLANFSIWQGWWQSVFAVLLPIALAAGAKARGAEARGARPPPSRS